MKPTAEHYDLIRRPLVTEKSTMASSFNTVLFETHPDADKRKIKEAVEAIFSVKVKSVNTLILKGKKVRFRGRIGQRKKIKKALVRLEEGYTIDTGVSG
ncbi:MAG: 50S ribosomal protein L23 [Rhodobacteraceae bacterium]|nr:50S ribosomal protein L23 [Paracoccaceae bacterium]